jgi:arylsulfatase A
MKTTVPKNAAILLKTPGGVGIIFLILLLFFSGCIPEPGNPNRPNVIIIMADDLGYETIGANGGKSYKTPEIDRMASQGMRFEHCYAQPLCTPTRVKLMTGIYNVRNYVRFGILEESQTTFAHLFKDAGYATCIVGKWQLGKDPMSPRHAGFDEHCLWQIREGRIDSTGRDTRFSKPVLEINGDLITYGEKDYGPQIVSTYGMDFMEKSVQKNQPFLLYYPMILTHCPFSATPDSPEWMTDDTTVMAYKGHAHYFEDMMAYTDKIIGLINQKLDQLGISENTLILFTGDNGTDVPVVSMLNDREVAGAKGQSTDAGTRVPLIVQWPGEINPGLICKDLVDFSDFLPTICEATNISVPDSLNIDGRSFLPQLKGESGKPRAWIYNWYSRNGEVDKARIFARNHRYKLYHSGEFYEVPQDYLEEHPLDTEYLGADAKAVRNMLGDVLTHYEKRRSEDISPKE